MLEAAKAGLSLSSFDSMQEKLVLYLDVSYLFLRNLQEVIGFK